MIKLNCNKKASIVFYVVAILGIIFLTIIVNIFKNFAFLSLGVIYSIGFSVILTFFSGFVAWRAKCYLSTSMIFLVVLTVLPIPPWLAASVYYSDYNIFLLFSQDSLSLLQVKDSSFWWRFMFHFFAFLLLNFCLLLCEIALFRRLWSLLFPQRSA
jgi:hypothetical protein